MFSDTLGFVTKLNKTVCCSREVFLTLNSRFSLAFTELEPTKLTKLGSTVFVKAKVFDLSWLVKKYFLVVQSRLSSKKSKFCKFAGVALNKLRLLLKAKNSLPKFTFWNKARFTSSLVLDSWVNLDEFHILWEVEDESNSVLPTKLFAWVNLNKSVVLVFANNEFFKSHLFCFDWFKFV